MITDPDMSAVFNALAHESRRQMLDIAKDEPGIGVGDLARQFDVSRIAVMKHLGILERAGLLISEKVGRSRRLYFNPVPIQMIYERWTTEYSAYWSGQVTRLKYLAEARELSEQENANKNDEQRKD